MASDKTSTSGRLALRGPRTVIANFTPPIQAQLSGERLISIFESYFQQFEKHAITHVNEALKHCNRRLL